MVPRLFLIEALVQKGGQNVTHEAVERAMKEGATDLEIHDTVLIAAAFCMDNRYVDGLDTRAHRDAALCRSRGEYVARVGYAGANLELAKTRREP